MRCGIPSWLLLGAALAVGFSQARTVNAQPPGPAARDAAEPAPDETPAGDGETEDVEEARRRYAQGAEFFRRGRYAEAVAELTEAYRLWENPAILYALGQAYEGLTEVRQAIEVYRRYLDNSPPDDVRRVDVEERIDQLERLLATVRVRSNVPGTLYVDDEREGAVPGEFRLSTGRHRLEVRAEGHETGRQSIVIAAGTDRELVFQLQRLESTTQILQVQERRKLPRPVFYSMAGVTGASLLTWGSVATVTLVRRNQYNDDPTRDPSDERAARDWARRSDILLGVTGGLAAATLVIGLLTEWGDDPEDADSETTTPDLEVSILPQGAALGVTFRR